MTFDVWDALPFNIRDGWQHWLELFCVCRKCKLSTTFIVFQKEVRDKGIFKSGKLLEPNRAVDDYVRVQRYLSQADIGAHPSPEYLPANIDAVFREGAKCIAVECWNAAGTMFRMCVDLVTRAMLPEGNVPGLNEKTRRVLGLRLPWLFDNGHLPSDLRELSSCIREDGNDGAHAGSLTKEDAEDLLDFTHALLERLYRARETEAC